MQKSEDLEKIRRKDTLGIVKDKSVEKLLKNGEVIIWSGELIKINKRKRRQTRRFVLTNKRFFNLGDEKFLDA